MTQRILVRGLGLGPTASQVASDKSAAVAAAADAADSQTAAASSAAAASTSATQAASSATAAEAAKNTAVDISNIAVPDDVVTTLINDTESTTAAALNASIGVPLDDPDDTRGDAMIVHDAGTKLVTIRGAIRNQGDQSDNDHYWVPIIDENHQADVGVSSVTTGTAAVNINFTRNLGKRVSCAVTPDNDLISKGWTVGASFSSGMLQLTFKRAWTLTDELTWNGSAWTWAQGGRFTVDTDSGGVLTISHEALKGKGITLTTRAGSGTLAERQRYWPTLAADGGATSSSTSFKLAFYDMTTVEWVQVGTLSAAATAGAATLSTSASITAGSLIKVDDTTNAELVLTTGGTSGSGPYTVPVQAIAKDHASGVPVYKQRVAPALVTARTANEANNLRVLISRTWEGAVNPQTDINTTDLPLHNVWFEATGHLTNDDAG